jgi:DNA integrity scanning protein DisA with diadenylate cyclase activity
VGPLALIIIFQQEIRNTLELLGRTQLLEGIKPKFCEWENSI